MKAAMWVDMRAFGTVVRREGLWVVDSAGQTGCLKAV